MEEEEAVEMIPDAACPGVEMFMVLMAVSKRGAGSINGESESDDIGYFTESISGNC